MTSNMRANELVLILLPDGGLTITADSFMPNVPGQESPLASGMAPAGEAESAGDMPEVPKGRGFAPSAR